MARPETTGRDRPGPRRLLLPAATMAGLALAASFGVTRTMEWILSAQGGEAAEPPAARQIEASPAQRATGPLSRQAYQDAILGRDIFATRPDPRDEPWSPAPPGAPSGEVQLIATVVVEDTRASTALIATGRGENQLVRVYSAGDELPDEGRITRIDQGRVTLSSPVGEVQHLLLGARTEL